MAAQHRIIVTSKKLDPRELQSLINIRPAQGSRFMEVRDPVIRRRMLALVHTLVGRGESPT